MRKRAEERQLMEGGHCEGELSFAAGECECKWRCLCQHAGSHYKLISHVTKSTACSNSRAGSREGHWRRRMSAGWGQDEGSSSRGSSSRLCCQLTLCQSYDIQLGKVVASWWANVPYNMLQLPQLLPVCPNYAGCPPPPPSPLPCSIQSTPLLTVDPLGSVIDDVDAATETVAQARGHYSTHVCVCVCMCVSVPVCECLSVSALWVLNWADRRKSKRIAWHRSVSLTYPKYAESFEKIVYNVMLNCI